MAAKRKLAENEHLCKKRLCSLHLSPPSQVLTICSKDETFVPLTLSVPQGPKFLALTLENGSTPISYTASARIAGLAGRFGLVRANRIA
ncbi:MAG: hypothetical protein ACE5I2_05905 [Anaerolineae bacterium]